MISDSSVSKLATEPCLVCHIEINTKVFPELKTRCGHWHCERCMMVLASHCSICDREMLNQAIPCETCNTPAKMYQSRSCSGCSQLCCVSCGELSKCCWLAEDEVNCCHMTCPTCTERKSQPHKDTESCVDCGGGIDTKASPYSQLLCGHWQCLVCTDDVSGYCLLCDQEAIHEPRACKSCDRTIKTWTIKRCTVCGKDCCMLCSERTYCCNNANGDPFCVHAVCSSCQTY